MMNDNPRCLYDNNFTGFLGETEMSILGKLVNHYHGEARTTTIDAWKGEINIMRQVLSYCDDKNGRIIFEYDIPRLGKRIDIVLLYKGIVFCIEFKVGETQVLEADVDQVLDYALDLKNFHKFSQDNIIVPILVATKHKGYSSLVQMSIYDDKVVNPLMTGESHLFDLITGVLNRFPNEKPVKSKDEQRKSICFVTGVPGAGKTLVGLDVAIKQTYQGHDAPVEGEGAVYLSGNGPLVAVLTEALAQDNYKKSREKN